MPVLLQGRRTTYVTLDTSASRAKLNHIRLYLRQGLPGEDLMEVLNTVYFSPRTRRGACLPIEGSQARKDSAECLHGILLA